MYCSNNLVSDVNKQYKEIHKEDKDILNTIAAEQRTRMTCDTTSQVNSGLFKSTASANASMVMASESLDESKKQSAM